MARRPCVLVRGWSNRASLFVVGYFPIMVGIVGFPSFTSGKFSLWTMVVLPLIFAGTGQLLRIVYPRIYRAVFDVQWTHRQARADDPLTKGKATFLAGLIDKLLSLALLLLVIAPGAAIYLTGRQASPDLLLSLFLGISIYIGSVSLFDLHRVFKLLPRPIPLPAGRIPQTGVEIWADQQVWLFADGSLWKIGPPGQWEQVLGVPPARKLTGTDRYWAISDDLDRIWFCKKDGYPELLPVWQGATHLSGCRGHLVAGTPDDFLWVITPDKRYRFLRLPEGIAELSVTSCYGAVISFGLGILYTWGENKHGQLGDGSKTDRYKPEAIAEGFQSVICGHDITIAVDQKQKVWVWGYAQNNAASVAAQKKETAILAPRLVPGLEAIVEIALGKNHALALDQQGQVKSWGFSLFANHALGTGNWEEKRPYPVPLPKPAQHIYTAGSLSLAVLADGSVYGWGMPWPNTAPAILPNQQEIPAIP